MNSMKICVRNGKVANVESVGIVYKSVACIILVTKCNVN